jgi:hypothetical protein
MILHRVTVTENHLLKQELKPNHQGRKTSIYDLTTGLKLVLKYDF